MVGTTRQTFDGRMRTTRRRQQKCHSFRNSDGGCYNGAVFLHKTPIHLHCQPTKFCSANPTCSASTQYAPAPTMVTSSISPLFALYQPSHIYKHQINSTFSLPTPALPHHVCRPLYYVLMSMHSSIDTVPCNLARLDPPKACSYYASFRNDDGTCGKAECEKESEKGGKRRRCQGGDRERKTGRESKTKAR